MNFVKSLCRFFGPRGRWVPKRVLFWVLIVGSLMSALTISGLGCPSLEAAGSSSLEGIENPQHLPILLEFSLDICVPCRKMKPILEEVGRDYQGKLLVKILEIDEYRHLARQFEVRALPTQIFLDSQEKVVQRHEGFLDKSSLVGLLSQMGIER